MRPKHHNRKSVFISFVLFICLFSVHQTKAQIRGKVIDSLEKPVDNAMLSLINPINLSLIKSLFTEADGSFEFEQTKPDTVNLMITAFGYHDTMLKCLIQKSSPLNVNAIKLLNRKLSLNEVTVLAQLNFIERKADKTIVNPEALIASAGLSVWDVLLKSPGISTNNNGTIKLKGRSNISLMIDNKLSYLSGSELENYLRSLPANAVKHIELIANPSAKYDASGNAGIINIITKRNKLDGINGNVSLNYAQGRYHRTNNNLNLNFGSKKWAIFSSFSYGLTNRFQDLNIYRTYLLPNESPKSYFNQNTYIKINTQSYNAKFAADYYLNKNTIIGVSLKSLYNPSMVKKTNKASVMDSVKNLRNIVLAQNEEQNLFQNQSFNLNLRKQLDTLGQMITVDADVLNYQSNLQQVFYNQVQDKKGSEIYSDHQSGSLPSNIQIVAVKSDYSKAINQRSKLEAGLKSSFTRTNNNAVYTINQNSEKIKNDSLSNHFLYNENINAAYFNYSTSFKSLEFQTGLRLENTQLRGEQVGNDVIKASNFNKNYTNLFPTLFLTYKLDSNAFNTLSISYGKRIDRAFYKDLNPFISPLDKFTFYGGNPFLQASFGHNVSLTYSYKGNFSTTFSYNNLQNKIQETIEIKDGIYYSRPGNIGSSIAYNWSVEGNFNINKILTTNAYSELNYSEYKSKLYSETLYSKGVYWFVNINNGLKLNKVWTMELNGEYLTKVIDSQFAFGDYGQASMGIQKNLFNGKGNFKLNISDVFYTLKIRGIINTLNLTKANWNSVFDSRVVSFTFTYRFGKNTNKKQKYSSNAAETEQKRVKS